MPPEVATVTVDVPPLQSISEAEAAAMSAVGSEITTDDVALHQGRAEVLPEGILLAVKP